MQAFEACFSRPAMPRLADCEAMPLHAHTPLRAMARRPSCYFQCCGDAFTLKQVSTYRLAKLSDCQSDLTRGGTPCP
jgi:hypothetical protein